MAANKQNVIEALAGAAGISKAEAERQVTNVLGTIAAHVQAQGGVAIAGFGVFTLKRRPERPGRNPATGESMTLPASATVGFKPAKQFKDLL